MKYIYSVLLHLIWFNLGVGAPLMGPGLQNTTYATNQVFASLYVIKSHDLGHGTIVMHNGYLVVIYAPDSGKRGGGFSFLNASDLTNPTVVFDKYDATTTPIREPHGFGIRRNGDNYHVVLQAIEGLMFWDWTDVTQPVLNNYLILPEIQESDYDRGVWWSAWQGEYLYAGGSSNGLYVVKAKDPSNPQFIKKMATSQTGGFRVGPVFAVGNLLYISNMDSDKRGFSILDIGNPEDPVLISTLDSLPGYSSLVNGYRFYAIDEKLGVIDVSDPTRPQWLGQSQQLGGKGGYATFQDGYVHMGSSSNYSKIDVRTNSNFNLVGTGSSGLAGRDEDFGSVLGNVVIAGNDHVEGSAIIPHQEGPDNLGPEVNMVVPYDKATGQPVTSRVGLTFTDNVELSTVVGNVIIREQGGQPLAGAFTHQVTIVNFSPDQPLKPNTTYEVVVPANGVEDWVGNKNTIAFQSSFTTGTIPPPKPVPFVEVTSFSGFNVVKNGTKLNSVYYMDRTFTLTNLPSEVIDMDLVQTANDDKANTQDNLFTLKANVDATLYLYYDQRSTAIPNWMNNWTKTNNTVATTDVTMDVYTIDLKAGETVIIGGAMAAGQAGGAISNYFLSIPSGELTSVKNSFKSKKQFSLNHLENNLVLNIGSTNHGVIKIIDSQGKVLLNKSFVNGNHITLSKNKLTEGMYFIRINLGQQILLHKMALFNL